MQILVDLDEGTLYKEIFSINNLIEYGIIRLDLMNMVDEIIFLVATNSKQHQESKIS